MAVFLFIVIMLNVANDAFLLTVVMLSVVMPNRWRSTFTHFTRQVCGLSMILMFVVDFFEKLTALLAWMGLEDCLCIFYVYLFISKYFFLICNNFHECQMNEKTPKFPIFAVF